MRKVQLIYVLTNTLLAFTRLLVNQALRIIYPNKIKISKLKKEQICNKNTQKVYFFCLHRPPLARNKRNIAIFPFCWQISVSAMKLLIHPNILVSMGASIPMTVFGERNRYGVLCFTMCLIIQRY